MPWKERCCVCERGTFVQRLLDGERMTDLCREYGVSRKTGYKYRDRYLKWGPDGLVDESRRPERIRHRTPPEIEEILLEARQAHPTWGPKKLQAWLARKQPGLRLPAPSTIGGILKRHGLVKARRRSRRTPPQPGPLRVAMAPNDLWCADFKGEFRLGNGHYCYPLTISDQKSRCLLCCEGLESTKEATARAACELVFREFGLPWAMRSDNGCPFASRGIAGLSRLSVWWLRLGIALERIEPGHPEQNGRHERMHLTLKRETTRPAAATFLQQQERFDRFRKEYNDERPHEALNQETPAMHYQPSPRRFPEKLPDLEYPLHDLIKTISLSGHLNFGGGPDRYVFLGRALGGEQVGLRELEDGCWLVSFATLDLCEVDLRNRIVVDCLGAEPTSPQAFHTESTGYQSPPPDPPLPGAERRA